MKRLLRSSPVFRTSARARINVSMSAAGAFTTELEARFVVTKPGLGSQSVEVLQLVAIPGCV